MARICFLVGSVAISGGTYVIFQHASHLKAKGHEITLAVQEAFTPETARWHDQAHTLNMVRFGEAADVEYDLVIATWWRTALDLTTYRARVYGYFVQSIESRFYPSEELPLRALVDSTYALPVEYVTEATWIVRHLKQNHRQEAALVRNGIRKDLYTASGPAYADRPKAGKPRVLVEGHLGVPFKNVALSIKVARKAGADEVWMLTGSPVSNVPMVDRVFSRVPAATTPYIYRSCDILLKLSTVEGMFGPPLEQMHCGGTSIVYDVSGHDEYIINHRNALVAQRGDVDQAISMLRRLLNERPLLDHLRTGARTTADGWPDWAVSSAEFQNWIDAALDAPASDPEKIRALASEAMSNYRRDEEVRLGADPSINRRRARERLMGKLPPRVRDYLRSAEYKREVLFRNLDTY